MASAKALVGEAAIRIVPSLKGFKPEADRRLKEMRFEPLRVRIEAETAEASAKMDRWRAEQKLNAVHVPVRADFASFKRDLSQVEHIFKRSAVSQAIRLNVKVIGLDALPALAYAAGSAASGLDALAKSGLALPGILGGVGASVGALLIGIHGLSDVFKAYSTDAKNTTQDAQKQEDANRALTRSYQDYKSAVRDTIREIQDLNTENRRSSLNVADALLSVQEARERLAKGGFSSITEYQRAQLGLAESINHVQDVMVKARRTTEDTNDANAKGVAGADKVVDALQAIASNTSKIKSDNISEVDKALAKLSPNGKKAAEAIHSFTGQWHTLQQTVQDNLFQGIDASITNLATKSLPGLQVGLSRVASGLNANLKSVAESLGRDQNQGFMQRIFGNTDGGLERMSRGMDPLITGMLRLSGASSNFLPRLADGFDKVGNRFDAWTDKIAHDGSLDKWIDSGLKAMDSIGHVATNIMSIVSSVSNAFDKASGHSGGFIKTFDDFTKKWAGLLADDKHQGGLIEYFRSAKDFTDNLKHALSEMRPFLKDVVDTSRQWSGILLPLIGMLLDGAAAIDKNTGAMKLLVATYLSVRTFKPLVEGLTTAWKNYNTVVTAAAKPNGIFTNAPLVQSTFANLQRAKGIVAEVGTVSETAAEKFTRLSNVAFPSLQQAAGRATPELNNVATAAGTASSKMQTLTVSAREAQQKFPALAEVLSNTVPPLNNAEKAAGTASSQMKILGDEGDKAGGKIGGAGKVSMLSRVGALGAALGPGAALMIGIPLAMFAIEKLGEAHRNAAADADTQRRALDRLKDSVNDVTGVAGKAAVAQLSKSNQHFTTPGLGERNASNDAAEIGSNGQELLQAQLPQNQVQRDALNVKALAATKAKIGASNDWREYGPIWDKYGIDLDTFSMAANGNEDALNHVRAAEKKMFNDDKGRDLFDPTNTFKNARIAGGHAAPDLTHTVINAGAQAPVSVAAALKGGEHTLRDAGVDARQANQAANGKGRFIDPNAANFWGQWGTDNSKVSIDPSGQAVIVSDQKPNVPPEVGEVVQDGNVWQTTLTQDSTNKYIQKFADGGMVRGPGGPRDDNILVATSPGEHVTNADAVRYYGVGVFNALNNKQMPKFAPGGWPFPLTPGAPTPPPTPAPVLGPPVPEHVWGGQSIGPPVTSLDGIAPADIPKPPSYFDQLGPLAPGSGAPTPVPKGPPGFNFGGAGSGGGSLSDNGLHDASVPASKLPLFNSLAPGDSPYAGAKSWDPNNQLNRLPGFGADILTGGAPTPVIPPPEAKPTVSTPTVPIPAATAGATTGAPAVVPPGGPIGTGSSPGELIRRGIIPSHGAAQDASLAPGFTTSGSAGTPPAGVPHHIPHTQVTPGPTVPQVPIGRTPAYALTPGPNGPVIAPNGPVMSNLNAILRGLVGTPYTASFSPAGLDCSGLASLVSNTVSGRDPWAGGRFTTHNELQELTARGFTPGKGPPGTVTIGWNDDHTAITLPDGTNVSSGEAGGFAYGGGGANQDQFTNWMYMPVDANGLAALNGALPGGGTPGPGVPGIGGPGGRGPGLAGLPANLKPGKILGSFGSVLLQGLAGAFGINTSYLGDIDQVANFGLEKLMGGAGQDPALTGLTDEALKDGANGQNGLSKNLLGGLGGVGFGGGAGGGANGPLSLDGNGNPTGGDLGAPGGGAGGGAGGAGQELTPEQIHAQYGGLIAQVCQVMGVDPAKWTGPLEKQIYSESKGNPNSYNDHDSNGQGGTQTVEGLFNFLPSTLASYKVSGVGTGDITDPTTQIAAAINYTKQRYGVSKDGAPLHIGMGGGFASGGYPDGLAYLSSGEFRSSPAATSYYGPALYNALNAKAIPRSTMQKFASGGFPAGIPRLEGGDFIPPIPNLPTPSPGAQGQAAGPLPGLGAPPPPPVAPAGTPPEMTPGAPPPMPGPDPSAPPFAPGPSTGGPPGPGATAPAPDPGTLPNVSDALAKLGGPGGSDQGAMAQPGADPGDGKDPRATLGAAPTSNDHNLPALSQGIQGAFQTAGNIGAMAASASSMGMGGAAGSLISAGAQVGGQVATSAVNILSSLLIGTATGGSTASASGVPMLPQRQPMQAGGVQPIQQRIHQGDINVTNLDEYKRQQQLMDAQDAMPWIGKY